MAIQYYNQGIDAIERGDTAAAVTYFEKSVQERDSDPDAHFNLGVALFGVGDYERALEEFQIASESYPDDPGLHVNLAETYRALGRHYAAKTEYEYALKRDPDIVGALTGLGQLMMQARQYEAAEEYLLRAMSLAPSDGATQLHLGWLYNYQGKYNEAAHYFFRGLRVIPNSDYGRLGLAESFLRREKYDEALPEYQKVYSRDTRNMDAIVGIGACYVATGEYVQARQILDKGVTTDADDPRPYKLLGDLNAAQEKFLEAVANYRMAVQIQDDFTDAHLGLGRVLETVGALDEAEETLLRALHHEPGNPEVLYRLGQLYATKGDVIGAESYLGRALEAAEDDFDMQRRVRETLRSLE